jgi:hypothetical protein
MSTPKRGNDNRSIYNRSRDNRPAQPKKEKTMNQTNSATAPNHNAVQLNDAGSKLVFVFQRECWCWLGFLSDTDDEKEIYFIEGLFDLNGGSEFYAYAGEAYPLNRYRIGILKSLTAALRACERHLRRQGSAR